jgi:hypothetical protein
MIHRNGPPGKPGSSGPSLAHGLETDYCYDCDNRRPGDCRECVRFRVRHEQGFSCDVKPLSRSEREWLKLHAFRLAETMHCDPELMSLLRGIARTLLGLAKEDAR